MVTAPRHSLLASPLLAALLLLGCGDASPDRDDAGSSIDAGTPASCNTDLMRHVIDDREIREGDYCDDIQLCAASSLVAEAIMSIAPGFDCEPGPGNCEPNEIPCVWNTPDNVDADEYEQLCAISVLEDAPITRCFIYL